MMNNIYVDIHVLQNVPPSCVNRDDTGSPKTAKYGGAVRARVSSQCWKHEMRQYFINSFDDNEVGIRTKNVLELIADEIKEIDDGINDKKALALAEKFAKKMANKKNGKDTPIIKLEKDKESGRYKSSTLVFFSKGQVKALAQAALNDATSDEYKEAFKSNPSADIVLFGRMVAEDANMNYCAAAQVAHAISTHAIHNEYDYFTANEEYPQKGESGAGHISTREFNSSTLYRYSNVNVVELQKNLGDSSPNVVKAFVESFIKSMPTGGQNPFANRTMPDYIYITLRSDQPINLVGAFEKPISGTDGYLEKSKTELMKYAEELYKKYDCPPVKAWNLDEMSFNQILEELQSAVKEKLSESEGE